MSAPGLVFGSGMKNQPGSVRQFPVVLAADWRAPGARGSSPVFAASPARQPVQCNRLRLTVPPDLLKSAPSCGPLRWNW